MKIARVLGSSAATAVIVLVPTSALAADGNYGGTGSGSGTGGATQAGPVTAGSESASTSVLPSTGSTILDAALGGAGLLLLLGGGATVVAARRKAEAQPA